MNLTELKKIAEIRALLPSESDVLISNYEKAVEALKVYENTAICLEDGDTFSASQALKELGEL